MTPRPWILPGRDLNFYLVALARDGGSLARHKKASFDSIQAKLGEWMASDVNILQDIYRVAKASSTQAKIVIPNDAQLKTFLTQEFQFGRLVAYEFRAEPIQLSTVTVYATARGTMSSMLEQTLLHAAKGFLKDSFTGAQRLAALGSRELQGLDEARIRTKKVWEYRNPALDMVTQVTARHRTMHDMVMPVLDSIHWGEVGVKPYNRAKLSLPLTQPFLLKTQSLDEGVVPESSAGFWQLPANLHSSFHHIFGYEISSAGRVQPIATPDKGAILPMGVQQPFRVLVCLALGCAGERNDFEPGGVLGAARLLPHLMIATNKPVESVEGAITLRRNERTPHVVMDDDKMTPEISSGLYTDNNDTSLAPELPYWNLLFDYYWTDPLPGKFEVVKRGAVKRTLEDAVKSFHEEVASSHGASIRAGGVYRTRDVTKWARQGEFDNIHIAPKMTLPADAVANSPSAWKLNVPVSMAPFCAHDCFHTHWRWGNLRYDPFGWFETNPKWVRGWGGGSSTSPGTPYTEPGAPLVPCNQDVTIHLLDKRSFKYVARAHAPVVGEWQVIMHHGSAYAIDTNRLANTVQRVLSPLAGLPGDTDKGRWARFYWSLRYETYVPTQLSDANPTLPLSARGLKFAERLQMDATTLAKLRTL